MTEDLTVACDLCGAVVHTDRESAQTWMDAHQAHFHPHPELEARALELLERAPAKDNIAWAREHLQRHLAMHPSDHGLRAFIDNMERQLGEA